LSVTGGIAGTLRVVPLLIFAVAESIDRGP